MPVSVFANRPRARLPHRDSDPRRRAAVGQLLPFAAVTESSAKRPLTRRPTPGDPVAHDQGNALDYPIRIPTTKLAGQDGPFQNSSLAPFLVVYGDDDADAAGARLHAARSWPDDPENPMQVIRVRGGAAGWLPPAVNGLRFLRLG